MFAYRVEMELVMLEVKDVIFVPGTLTLMGPKMGAKPVLKALIRWMDPIQLSTAMS
jgi:hypothetical protein